MSEFQPARLDELLADLLEGGLDDSQQAELNDLLAADSDARRLYREHLALHTLLHWKSHQGPKRGRGSFVRSTRRAVPAKDPRPLFGQRSRTHWVRRRVSRATQATVAYFSREMPFSLSTAVIITPIFLGALLLFVAPRIGRQEANVAPTNDTPESIFIAQITHVRDARWSDGTEPMPWSRVAEGQKLELKTGDFELTFNNGARVLLQGPATLRLESSIGVALDRGRLTARVGQSARGFQVDTPLASVVDLGTEFGVAVSPSGDVRVHVFEGRVECQPADDDAEDISLTAGQGLRFASSGGPPSRVAMATGFARLASREENPLVAFYPLDGDARDASGNNRHAVSASSIEFVDGHEGKAARFAGRADSFIDLPIDAGAATMPALTFGAWVRPAKVGAGNQAMGNHEILSTDDGGFDRTLTIDARSGQASTGELRFAAFTGSGVLASTAPPPQAGRWTFVAVVYNERTRTAKLYVEDPALGGMLVEDAAYGTSFGPSAGHLRIGMHAAGQDEPFAGEIDNVFVFRSPLGKAALERIRTEGAQGVLSLIGIATSNSATQSQKKEEPPHPD